MTKRPGAGINDAGWHRSTVATSGNELPQRGEVWWVRVDKRRPAVVVQTDKVREPRVRSFLVVPLTSRLHLEGLPGNVRLDRETHACRNRLSLTSTTCRRSFDQTSPSASVHYLSIEWPQSPKVCASFLISSDRLANWNYEWRSFMSDTNARAEIEERCERASPRPDSP
jgi:mRNA-degrading endonuclease toxin of MazEF toxin-antitoxin module